MALTTVRASTPDGTAGLQVATATNEDAAGTSLQGMVALGNKSTWSDLARTSVAAADTATDLSTVGFAGLAGVNLADCGNALNIEISAHSSVAVATISGFLVFYDSSNAPLSVSETLTITTSSTLRLAAAGDYICPRYVLDAGKARKFAFYISTLSAGVWVVNARPI